MIKGIEKAGSVIEKAAEREEVVYLFGDGDLDGIASVLIMERALKDKVRLAPPLFSDREKQGYGLSEPYLELLASKKPGLIILFDCGTGNRKEVQKIKKMGFSVVIVDHHKPVGPVPKASAIVNPKMEQESPWINLCAAAVTDHLARFVLGQGITESDDNFFSVLACLATISDQMVRDEINEEIVEKGVQALVQTNNPVLTALREAIPDVQGITAERIERYVTPLLSSASQTTTYLLLREKSEKAGARSSASEKSHYETAAKVVDLLQQKRELQRERVEEIVEEVQDRMDLKAPLIFEGDKDWPLFLAARAASKLVNEFDKPVFLYNRGEETSQGSARAPSEYDLLEMMRPCSRILINWGGHTPAAGFGLKNKDLEFFERCLAKNL